MSAITPQEVGLQGDPADLSETPPAGPPIDVAGTRRPCPCKPRPSSTRQYLRLIDANRIEWENQAHFFAISANLMRRVLFDFARAGPQKKHAHICTYDVSPNCLVMEYIEGTPLAGPCRSIGRSNMCGKFLMRLTPPIQRASPIATCSGGAGRFGLFR